jgi:hypothetical protein
MPDMAPQTWALLLIAAAAISLVFTLRRIGDGGIPPLLAAGAIIFRIGLLAVGVVYATGAVRTRWTLLAALGLVAVGAALNLVGAAAGALEAHRHRRRGASGSDATPAGPRAAGGDTSTEEPRE